MCLFFAKTLPKELILGFYVVAPLEHLVRTITTSVQYFPVRPSATVSKKLRLTLP